MLYNQIQAENKRLTAKVKELKQQLKRLPEGDFFCSKNGKYYKWYLTDGKTQTYIPKTKRQFAEKMATKKYLSYLLDELLQEKKAIDAYLKCYKAKDSQAERMFFQNSEYQELISAYFKPISKEIQEWATQPFKSNPKYPEQLIHKTYSGRYVRSKSEAMIDMFLYKNKVPFRYEAALEMEDLIIYPDFTIRHPETGELFYWEHFGLVDDFGYCQNMLSKLRLYTAHGLIPSIQLITTYETKEHPLSAEMVERIVEYYFT